MSLNINLTINNKCNIQNYNQYKKEKTSLNYTLSHKKENTLKFVADPAKVKKIALSIIIKELKEEELKGKKISNPKLYNQNYWSRKCSNYKKIEKWIQENSHKITPWTVAGPLHYGMSPEKMRNALKNKLLNLADSGQLMTESTFLRRQAEGELFYTTPRPSDLSRNEENLTRIWGAEHIEQTLTSLDCYDGWLKQTLFCFNNYSVAKHYLVVPDNSSELSFSATSFNGYPVLSKVKNAKIVAQLIKGKEVAHDCMGDPALKCAGYKDFIHQDNIIESESNGIKYVVDTEISSFKIPKWKYPVSLDPNYLARRFKVLNPGFNSEFTFSKDEINLD